mmetsp:Transcript_78257/g.123543  ORF Transcript_78257/g.123543 Transcript_78257/m.123543 type:complete len:188 (+) Transcript_78257:134-697(+)
MKCHHHIEVALHTPVGHRDPVVTIPISIKSRFFPPVSEHVMIPSKNAVAEHRGVSSLSLSKLGDAVTLVDESYLAVSISKVQFPPNWQPTSSEIVNLGVVGLTAPTSNLEFALKRHTHEMPSSHRSGSAHSSWAPRSSGYDSYQYQEQVFPTSFGTCDDPVEERGCGTSRGVFSELVETGRCCYACG